MNWGSILNVSDILTNAKIWFDAFSPEFQIFLYISVGCMVAIFMVNFGIKLFIRGGQWLLAGKYLERSWSEKHLSMDYKYRRGS